MSERILGIDLGTANSAAAVLAGSKKEDCVIVPSSEGTTAAGIAFPSCVAFNKAGDYNSAGIPALRRADRYPEETICNIKRIVGRSYDDAEDEINKFSCKNNIYRGSRGEIEIRIGKHEYSTEDIAKFLIEKIKKDAEGYLEDEGFLDGKEIKNVVITTPAYFSADQTTAIENAGRAAGFEHVEMLPESIAAAKAYALKAENEQIVTVVDLGAGTLDVTIVTMFYDSAGDFIMKDEGTHGHRNLGGLDMDRAIIEYLEEEFRQYDRGYDLTKDVKAIWALKYAAEHAKITLSTLSEAPITIQYDGGRKTWTTKLSRNKLGELVKDIVDKCQGPIREALHRSGNGPEQIDRVLLVGGPMQMPIVREMIIDEFKENEKVVEELMRFEEERHVDPMECVAMGAALSGETIGNGPPDGPREILGLSSGYGILLADTINLIIKQGTIYRPGGAEGKSYYFVRGTESSIPIIEVHEDEKTSTATYQDLGHLKIVLPSLEDRRVDVTFKVNENKNLDVTFYHSTIGEIPYEKVNYGGKPIDILEHALENTEERIDEVNGLKDHINKPEIVEKCVKDLRNELNSVPTNRDDLSGKEKRELADRILRKKHALGDLGREIIKVIVPDNGDYDGGPELPPLEDVIPEARQLLRVAGSHGITGEAISLLEVELGRPRNVARILNLMRSVQDKLGRENVRY